MTREAALDSQVVAQLSQLGRQKAQSLNTDLVVFQPSEFCEKLVSTSYNYDRFYFTLSMEQSE